MRRLVLAGALAMGMAVAVAPAAVASTTAAVPAAAGAVAPIAWHACAPGTVPAGPYSCATYRVPIDHDNAALGTIDIALLKRAAAKPDQRIGSLFLNPGGPGGSGLRMPVSAPAFFDQPVLDRFDTIGFDPRGVGESNPLRCFTTAEDAAEVIAGQLPMPISRPEMSAAIASFRDYGRFCKTNGGALLGHMSTKDVVRDLDLLRAAAGDAKLNFVGFSYGTLIGATYAAMFPKNARALVIDGNVDPALRTSNGVQYDRERAQGFEIALKGFLEKCKQAGAACAFSGGQPKQKFDEIRAALRQGPVNLPGGTLDIGRFTSVMSSALYSPSGFSGIASELQTLYTAIKTPVAAHAMSAASFSTLLTPTKLGKFDARGDSPYLSDDSYYAVNCSDKKFRNSIDDLPALAASWERESPTFGRLQAFTDPAACPAWPVKNADVYRGPWRANTDNPVLVVGNYYDPATQYRFAQRMADQLGYSRLLSVDAFGHCILGDSAGVDAATADYLINLKVPAAGQVFDPDVQPFTAAVKKG
ncbi:alpha/beta hydrolase [Amycolatopsis minnesotensis]|uniref:Alpha/beta hydrolase n=1 Tax=Amycolatopsis minnesotensis TaxID=337894 RepID=A0ABN2S015_9PSEU